MKISIIIPTLNEEKYLRKTIQHTLFQASEPDTLEVLVIDAGSTDNTLKTIEDLGFTIFVRSKFKLQKAKSLNFGLQKATGEIVLFLDADTLLPFHFDAIISRTLENKSTVGGAFEMRFLNPDFKLSLLSKLNSFRYNIWKTCYGDQAIFCRKSKAIEVGGFDNALMEAAQFCQALKPHGKLKIIKEPVLTSPRRFNEYGFWRVFWFDVKMWLRFVFGLELKKAGKTYWKTNLQNG